MNFNQSYLWLELSEVCVYRWSGGGLVASPVSRLKEMQPPDSGSGAQNEKVPLTVKSPGPLGFCLTTRFTPVYHPY